MQESPGKNMIPCRGFMIMGCFERGIFARAIGPRAILTALLFAVLLNACSVPNPGDGTMTVMPRPDGEIKLDRRHVRYLKDVTGALRIKDVAGQSSRFQALPRSAGFGFQDAAFWVHFVLDTPALENPSDFQPLLLVGYPLLDTVELYIPDGEGWRKLESGDGLPLSARRIKHSSIVFPLPRETGKRIPIYLRIRTESSMQFPLRVLSMREFIQEDGRLQYMQGAYYGLIIAIALFNVMIFFFIRDRTLLYYVAYLFAFMLFILTASGYSYRLFWPELPWLSNPALVFSLGLGYLAVLQFGRAFLNTREHAPYWDRALLVLMIAAAYMMLSAPFPTYRWSFQIRGLIIFVVHIALVLAAIQSWRKGSRPAGYFMIAWSFLMAGIVVTTLKNLGLIPSNTATKWAAQLGSVLEISVLALGLADRINTMRVRMENARSQVVKHLVEMDKLKDEHNRGLEAKIEERTAELKDANGELLERQNKLEEANRQLLETQSQLIQTEKMASLGTLVAGVAHEVNNPVNFIQGYLRALNEQSDRLWSFFRESMNPMLERIDDNKLFNQILDEMDKHGVYDTVQGLPEIISKMSGGVQRIAGIVNNLKSYSKPDEAQPRVTDVHECIEATLRMIPPTVLKRVEIRRDFDELPPVMALPGQLEQVFMNIIVNASQAMKGQGEIAIQTRAGGENLEVIIRDQGPGIPPEIRPRIFDPFFTTRSQGEGTGLGLAISYAIIQRQGGTLLEDGAPGQGARFRIILPSTNHSNQAAS